MTRVKSGVQTKRRHKKVLKEASGYFGSKHRLYKSAKEQLMHSSVYAYRDRRQKKREFRKLWITRINAACRMNNISYSKFINGLSKAGVEVNRKMLAELAIEDMDAFKKLVEVAKKGAVDTKKVEKKTEVKEDKKEVKEEKDDLSSKTVAELKEMAKAKGVEGISTMKKADLIAALK